jgi:hypothetical protein
MPLVMDDFDRFLEMRGMVCQTSLRVSNQSPGSASRRLTCGKLETATGASKAGPSRRLRETAVRAGQGDDSQAIVVGSQNWAAASASRHPVFFSFSCMVLA